MLSRRPVVELFPPSMITVNSWTKGYVDSLDRADDWETYAPVFKKIS